MKPVLLAVSHWLAALTPSFAGPQGITSHDTPQDIPEVRFVTEDGTRKTLDAIHGKVILLNIWATWCPPCAKEMPTLDALQADLGNSKFEVVTLSIDTGGVPVVRRFFDKFGLKHLDIATDPTQLSFTNLRVVGLPTTRLINADGKEVARLVGPATWNGLDMEAFLKSFSRWPTSTAPHLWSRTRRRALFHLLAPAIVGQAARFVDRQHHRDQQHH